ncbi:MAG: 1-deoxy-D-xylulose-5-phosphate synthase [Planctomycetes bacterium]|nr:1-deoxy-D-xylulose-5-phosphate synthase [Planctomycetota bacterium]
MPHLLDSIESPADVRDLSLSQLDELASEVRELIIEVVSKNRGHLASNLGVVELTLALHHCFDFEQDRLIWDCGHQTYTHKIITGRRDRFPTLRQEGGISGFANQEESPYDTFTFGHTASSISAAAGIAAADLAQNRDRHVVAVIGDGAIASGMAFEALNHAGALGLGNLLVVLNDNRMSISRSVGALSRYLRKLRSSPPIVEARRELQELINMIPVLGHRFDRLLSRVREGLQTALTPGGIFVDLGFRYYGPVDGHNTEELVDAFSEAQRAKKPALLHVVTEKGHGFQPARDDPSGFHSAGRFEHDNGAIQAFESATGRSYSSVFGDVLCRLADEDPKLVAITAAMPAGTGLGEFSERFPDRFYDVGICEQHGVGLANGLSKGGMKPVFAVYSTFLQRAFDQLYHDVALQGASVVFCIDRAGFVGADGPTHHGLGDIACTRVIPGFVVMAPRDGEELEAMIRLALEGDFPAAIRYPRENVPENKEERSAAPLELGRAEICRRGEDAAIVAYGVMAGRALEAADILAREDGLEVTVVNARFAAPLDRETICRVVSQHPAVLIAEDHSVRGGFGSGVLEMLAQESSPAAHVALAGAPQQFIAHATRERQLARCGLDGPGLAERLKTLLDAAAR